MAQFDRIAVGGFLNHNRTPGASAPLAINRSHLVALAFSAVLAACGGDGGSGGGAAYSPTGPAPTPTAPGSVAGRVQSASDGALISGATVTVDGDTLTTGADGVMSFPDLAQIDRLAVTVSAPGFADTVRYTAVSNNVVTRVPLMLPPVAATASIDAAVGGTATVPGSTARIVFPAGSIVTSGGAAPTVPVLVQLVPIATSQDANLLTGDYRTSATGFLETFGGFTVMLTDASGGSYQLAAGQSATIRVPVSTRGTALGSATLYAFDESDGYWKTSGSVTLDGSNTFYEATVTQISAWTVGTALDTVQVTGCTALPNGARIGRARIEVDGISYSGTSSIITDGGGNFSVPVRRNSTVAVLARAGSRLSNARSVTTAGTDTAVSGGCLVLADAAISIRLSWGQTPTDVDSHILTPQLAHVDWTNKGSLSAAPFVNLDIDDVTSFGPEYVTIRRVARGTYRYFLHNFTGAASGSMKDSPVKVEVTHDGITRVYRPSADDNGRDYWNAFDIVVDAQCNVTFTTNDTWSATEPINPNAGGAVSYCN